MTEPPKTPDLPEPPGAPPPGSVPPGGYGPPPESLPPGGYGPPPPGAPTGYQPPSPPGPGGTVYQRGGGQQDLLGWLALVFGVLATGCCCCPWLNGLPFLGGIPALVLGILHLQRVRKGQATMGWLGWVGIALGALAIIGAICGIATDYPNRIYDDIQDSY